MSSSAHLIRYPEIARKLDENKIKLIIDFKSALSEQDLDKRILRDFEEFKNKDFRNSLEKLLPQKLIPVIVDLSGINPNKKVNEISKEERKRLVNLLKNFEVIIKGFRPIEEAIITAGGISTKEINPKTMESKIVKGLYFAGEIIDVDAYTGGFNLQIAYSTGFVAGKWDFMFKTIKENVSGEIVEKKSKFIANIFYIESVEEAEKKIAEISKKYFDAKHNCYAFSIYTENGIVNRFSDNGEPSRNCRPDLY